MLIVCAADDFAFNLEDVKESPESRLPLTLLGQVGAVVVAALLAYWFIQLRSLPADILPRRECENAYRDARTLGETLAVDASEPVIARRDRSAIAMTCGSLRKANRLNR